jgi:hypothetical protein
VRPVQVPLEPKKRFSQMPMAIPRWKDGEKKELDEEVLSEAMHRVDKRGAYQANYHHSNHKVTTTNRRRKEKAKSRRAALQPEKQTTRVRGKRKSRRE